MFTNIKEFKLERYYCEANSKKYKNTPNKYKDLPFECFFLARTNKKKDKINNIVKECVFVSSIDIVNVENCTFTGDFDKALTFTSYKDVMMEYTYLTTQHKDFDCTAINPFNLFVCKYYPEQDRFYFYEETEFDNLVHEMNRILPEYVFINAIENIQKQREKNNKVEKALNEICNGHFVFDSENLYHYSLLRTMEIVLSGKDNTDTLEWWLYEYENPLDRKYYYDGKYIVVTPHLLYQFLIAEKKDENFNDIIFSRYGTELSEKEKVIVVKK